MLPLAMSAASERQSCSTLDRALRFLPISALSAVVAESEHWDAEQNQSCCRVARSRGACLMTSLLLLFKAVSLIFAGAAIFTGLKGLLAPVAFAESFGISITRRDKPIDESAQAYVSLMSVRQLATGITLLAFAYQGKWDAMATMLANLGVVVACTDGAFLARRKITLGAFHAIPGLLIAILAAVFLWRES